MDGRPAEVTVGPHRISATKFGSGGPAVIVEPGFGGTARSWQAVAGAVAADTTVVTYDRSAYGTSSRAEDHRTPAEIAGDLHGVLDALGIARPVILVGHSAGGVYVRAFAGMYDEEVAGLVLVDSSHEAQEQELRDVMPWRETVAEKVIVPVIMAMPRKVRGGSDRRSMMRELGSFRQLTEASKPIRAGGLSDRPVVVLTRGAGKAGPGREGWRRWHALHEDLARLSANSRHVVSGRPGHYIHKSDPDLVTASIRDVLHSARTESRLA
jgi:pimeloyl-ACP methyl ester carboxylesterase